MRTAVLSLTLSVAARFLPAQSIDVPLSNWTVPTYRASSAFGGLTTMTDVTSGIGFVGIQPCRVADTRGNGAPIQGGIFPNSGLRTWDLTGLCGLPAGTDAISVNFSVVSAPATPAGAFLLAWPTGTAPPPTAIMTYGPGSTIISNAAIVPLGSGEQLNVNVSHSTHVILDVNGYFTDNYNDNVAFVASSSTGGAAIIGQNTSTAPNAVAIRGVITSTNPGDFATAVMAVNNGDGYGLWATSATGFGVVGAGGAGGVWATTDGLNANGVYGQHTGSSSGSGVYGQTASTASKNAGVWGVTSGTTASNCCSVAGVRGESRNDYGVLGISINGAGVLGTGRNNSDQEVTRGELGGTFYGVRSVGPADVVGTFTATMKSFVEPHPLDASKEIRYVSLEGPRSEVYFRGTAQVSQGVTRIPIPDEFRLVADPGTYSTLVTPLGSMATVAVISEGEDGIVIEASRNVKVHYVVYAERESVHQSSAIIDNVHFRGDSEVEMRHFPESYRQRMIRNRTLNPDGTVNTETARRLGWDKEWAKRERPVPQPASD